jgi:hypothetical protein
MRELKPAAKPLASCLCACGAMTVSMDGVVHRLG